MNHIGFVVNPIAGMGGRVGLKGTDGKVAEARERGAEPRAPERAREAMESLHDHEPETRVTTVPGVMGADECRAAGFDTTVLEDAVEKPAGGDDTAGTSAADTRAAVEAFLDAGVDLVLFVGGDGTAVDVAETIEAAGSDTPMLGVPAGVKIYSSVFAVTPRAAGRIVASYDRVAEREVNDIDEDDYREGEVHTELRAVVRVPVTDEVQSSKQLAGGTVETLAAGFAADVEPGVTYVLGPGSTVGAVKHALGFDGSPLGVDVWRATTGDAGEVQESGGEVEESGGEVRDSGDDAVGAVLSLDAAESDVLDALGERNVVVVSPIGGQGFIFGRGNQQLSPAVLRRSEVQVVASKAKLDELSSLRVDTGDEDLDEELRGWLKVRVGRFEQRLMRVV